MKKIITLVFLTMCSVLVSRAQIDWGAYSQSNSTVIANNPSAVGIIVNIPKANNSFWTANSQSKYFYQLTKDTTFRRQHADNIVARTTFDTSKVHFFLNGVNPGNASDYQYRVMEYPTRVVEPWQPVNHFSDSVVLKQSGMPQMGYLGGYRAALSNMLIVDVRKTGQKQIVATALVAWESIRPIVTNIYTSDTFDAFLQRLQHPWSNQALAQKAIAGQDIKRPSANTNFIFFVKADIYHRKQLQYQLLLDNKETIAWKDNDYDNSFIWLKQTTPGKYQLNIRYAVQPKNITSYRFEVEAAWYQTIVFKIAAGIFFAALGGAFLFVVLLLRQKKLTKDALLNKTKLKLELRAIHAQLNPHFVFNALSSIQGLINVQNIKSANAYLADFARLMRESLKGGDNEEIPLKKEIEFLETYLRLEQLRFGFNFHISLSQTINPYEINVPSLLLQPLVENAVKHGVGSLQAEGNVRIVVDKTDDALVIAIIDNGAGFVTGEPTLGYGLKLTCERIELLNKLNPQQMIVLKVDGELTGTTATITFNNWFL